MVRKCISCGKKFSVINSRTFHQFPRDVELRKKWLNALNFPKLEILNLKTVHVCSDHFKEEDFCRLNNHTYRRKIRSFAVPKPNFSVSEDSADVSFAENTSDENKSSISKKIDELSKENNISDELLIPSNEIDCPEENELENKSNYVKSEIETSSEENDSKRQRLPSKDIRPRKKIRFIHEYKTEYISRDDFASDEAWKKFMRFLSYQKLKRGANYAKSYRTQKKLSTLKNAVQLLLNEREEFMASECL